MQWSLILEEYSPELIYIQGSKNIVADTLSILDMLFLVKNKVKSVNEHDGLEDEGILIPTSYKTITQNQQTKISHTNKDDCI